MSTDCFIFIGSDNNNGGYVVVKQKTTVLTGLHPWTNYSIRVSASTRAGEGKFSKPIHCITHQDGKNIIF